MPYDPPESGLNQPSVSFAQLDASLGQAPWRSPLVASPSVRVVLLCLPAGARTIPHFHPRAEEAFQVVRGVVGLTIGDEPEYLAEPGSLLLARRGVVHGIRIPGPESAVLMCTVAPNEDAQDEQVEVEIPSLETAARPPGVPIRQDTGADQAMEQR
jgi:quercetin dioxygenase-like cupin family protein